MPESNADLIREAREWLRNRDLWLCGHGFAPAEDYPMQLTARLADALEESKQAVRLLCEAMNAAAAGDPSALNVRFVALSERPTDDDIRVAVEDVEAEGA